MTFWSGLGKIAGSVVGQGLGMGLGKLFEGDQDKRQLDQQAKLNQLDERKAYNIGEMNQKNAMEMWEATGYGAQKKQLEAAGMNAGLMYGQGGQGGTTAGAAAAAGGSGTATDPSNAINTRLQMGMMLAQTELAKSQANKNNVEADKLKGVDTDAQKGNTAKTAVETAILNATKQDVIRYQHLITEGKEIDFEKYNAEWEAFKANGYPTGNVKDAENPANKAMIAGWEKTVQELKNAQTSGEIMKATQAIEEFKANLAKAGIAPDSPWYVKIVGDLLEKVGMNPLDTAKKLIK